MTIEQARKFIEKYPDHDSFVKEKHAESMAEGNGDNSVPMSMLWAKAKDMIWQEDSYKPIGCDHKKANGFSAWQLYSHSLQTGEIHSEQSLCVCEKCGDIKLSGHDNLNRYEYIFSIHWVDALLPIIKQANYIMEEKVFFHKDELTNNP